MTDTTSQFSFNDFVAFLSLLKAKKMITNDLYLRGKENIDQMKEEFYYAVRPTFLKFLLIVDKNSVERTFSKEEIQNIENFACLPKEWNIHHQKSIAWGGCNFNPTLLSEIRNTPLTEEQKQECEKDQEHLKVNTLRFQLNNYLEKAQKKGKLKKTFCNLFSGVLIVLPRDLHKRLEDEFMSVQKVLPSTEDNAVKTPMPPKVPISYPIWNQFIYQGDSFDETNPNELHYKKGLRKPSKKGKLIFNTVEKNPDRDEKKNLRREFHWPEKVSRIKRNILKEKAKRGDDLEYGD